tara:strand:- start:2071 stop:2445 length:375 start_codon:yes stop_codon:yes gene_type:complete
MINKSLLNDLHKKVAKDYESFIYPIELKDKSWIMTDIHKKIKHLNHTMIVWAENNKKPTHPNNPGTDWTIPPRKFYNALRGDVIVEWKDDLKFVTKLDRLLSDGETLTKKELEYCNQLYDFYKK